MWLDEYGRICKLNIIMEHFYNESIFGENWFDYPELYKSQVNKAQENSHFVEVGSWKGRSAAFMAVEIINSGKKIKFDCVDTWSGTEDPEEKASTPEYQNEPAILDNTLYDVFLKNIEKVTHIINPIKMSSTEAAKLYQDESLDFVFIDACHTYNCVDADIKAWLPKIKIGGMLCGHDAGYGPIDLAVAHNLPGNKRSGSCWVYTKS